MLKQRNTENSLIGEAPRRQAVWKEKCCDICGENNRLAPLATRTYELPSRYAIFEMIFEDVICENCGSVFARRIPNDDFLNEFYKDAFTPRSDYRAPIPDFDAAARLDIVKDHLSDGASLLEIGANNGAFCETLRQSGYRAEGLDPLQDKPTALVAEAFSGRGSSDKPTVVEKRDGVMAFYVLEHITNPRQWLEEAKAYLKPGGILILEVPDFGNFPVESFYPEHFLHFTREHLSLLLSAAGFNLLDGKTYRPSRYFGFLVVARLTGRTPGSVTISDSERARLVEAGRRAYTAGQSLASQEGLRAAALASEIETRMRSIAMRPAALYFWGANKYASDIAKKLNNEARMNAMIVDGASTKIGISHEGFSRPIQAPLFEKQSEACRIFVLCSPSWNREIVHQIAAMGLEDIVIIDGVDWKPDGK